MLIFTFHSLLLNIPTLVDAMLVAKFIPEGSHHPVEMKKMRGFGLKVHADNVDRFTLNALPDEGQNIIIFKKKTTEQPTTDYPTSKRDTNQNETLNLNLL